MKKEIIEIKQLLKTYEETNKELASLEIKFDADPENEEIEKEWDALYKTNYNALQAAAELIVITTMNMIDVKTARMMIITKREDLEVILNKAA